MVGKKETIWSKNFICALIAQSCMSLGQFMVNPIMTTYADHLGASAMMTGMTTAITYGVAFAMRPITGPAITRYNKKRLLLLGYLLIISATCTYAASSNIFMLMIGRALHGMGLSLVGSLTLTIAGDSLPPSKMASGLGVFGMGSVFMSAIAPSIGIALKDNIGFTMTFVVAAIIVMGAFFLCFLLTNKPVDKEAVKKLGAWYKNIFAKEAFVPSIANAFCSTAYSLYSSYLVLYAAEKNIDNIGQFFTVYAAAVLATRPFIGKFMDKFELSKAVYPATAFFAMSFVILYFGDTFATALAAAVVAAIGYGTMQPAMQTMCIQSVSIVRRGVASNTNYFGIDMGNFLGPTLAGMVITAGFNYSEMYAFAIIPVFLSAIVFSLGWKKFKERRAELDKTEKI